MQEVLKQEDWVKGMVNGKIVALSKRPFIKPHSLWARKDWLDALGLEVPKTLEDLVNVSVAFTKQDPDGNGVDDTYGFTAPGMTAAGSQGLFGLSPVFGAFGTTQEGQFYGKTEKRFIPRKILHSVMRLNLSDPSLQRGPLIRSWW